MYPSVFSPNTFDDQWMKRFLYETDNQKNCADWLTRVKNIVNPAVTYEVVMALLTLRL